LTNVAQQQGNQMRRFDRRKLLYVPSLLLAFLLISSQRAQSAEIDRRIEFNGDFSQAVELAANEVIEISVGVTSPSALPANGRLAVEWNGPADDDGWRKVVHALDPDVYVVYRAPQQGRYELTLRALEEDNSSSTVFLFHRLALA
jgi:hypothetical protein